MLKKQIKDLWQLCFNDSEAFTELYFTHRYNNDVNIYIQSGEEIISALQMLPYQMTFCNNEIPTAYISGACTHPDYRGKGVMHELLSQAFARMQSQGVALSTLIPASDYLFDYYRKNGYASIFNYTEENYFTKDIAFDAKGLRIETLTDFREDVYKYVSHKMEERPCCIQHTAGDFNVILADLRLANGSLFIAFREKSICGVVFCYPDGETLRVNELLADNAEIEEAVLAEAARQWKCDKITVIRPIKQGLEEHHLGMARIIDAKRVLQLFAATFPQEEMNLELTDDTLAANNGYYYINNGKCMKSEERLPGTHQRMNIEMLALKIFASLQPYMSLMLN